MDYVRKLITGIVCIFILSVALPVKAYTQQKLLTSTEELSKIMHNPNVRILDAVDPALYNRAHIPGAINIFYQNLTKIEERKKNGFPISEKEAEKIFSDAGIDSGTQVVVYDGGEGAFASGVWFVLDFFGHKNVRVLDGGFRKWISEGRPVAQSVSKVEKKKFAAKPRSEMIVTTEWIRENLGIKGLVILDSRSLKEYIGVDVRPGASRGGHIPGAIHLEWVEVSDKINSFKSIEELEKVFKQRGITKDIAVVTYCHSGIGRSTELAFALKLLGYNKVYEYTGSWEAWSSDPRLPIEK
ncbi:MAG: sulfurtransferase [Nitrospirota bacterium]